MTHKFEKSTVMYLGRRVDKESFRTFVYNENKQELAKSWESYKKMIDSGEWFDTKELALANKKVQVDVNSAEPIPEFKVRKRKNGDNS